MLFARKEKNETLTVIECMNAISKVVSQPEGYVALFIASEEGKLFINESEKLGLNQTIKSWSELKPSKQEKRQYGIINGINYLEAQVIIAWLKSRGF